MSKTNLSHRVKQTLLLLCLMCSAFGLKAAVVTPEANKTYFIVNKQTGCVLSNGIAVTPREVSLAVVVDEYGGSPNLLIISRISIVGIAV